MDVQCQAGLPNPIPPAPGQDPALSSTFEQSISEAGCGTASAGSASSVAAIARSYYGSCPVEIPVSLLQTPDDSPESAALQANGTDFRRQLYDIVRSAMAVAENAIRLGTEGPAPAIDSVTRAVLRSLGLNINEAGGIDFANSRAGGWSAAVASTSIGNEIPPDISEQLAAAGANCEFLDGYSRARDFFIARAQPPMDCGGEVGIAAAETPCDGAGSGSTQSARATTAQASDGSLSLSLAESPLGDSHTVVIAQSSEGNGTQARLTLRSAAAQRLLDEFGSSRDRDFVNLVAGTSFSMNTANFATGMVATVLRTLKTPEKTEAADLQLTDTRPRYSPLDDRPEDRRVEV